MMIILSVILPVVGVLVYFICTHPNLFNAKANVVMMIEKFPAKAKCAEIDVYRTNRPTVDYLDLAVIKCKDSNENWNMEQILIKSREIGADGLIMVDDSKHIGLEAIAIKYK